jgi:hypothetical protein
VDLDGLPPDFIHYKGLFQSPMVKSGTGVVLDAGKQNIDLAVASDFDTVFLDQDNMNYYFRV